MSESLPTNRIEIPPNLKDGHAEDSYAHPFLNDAVEIIIGEKTKPTPTEVLSRVAMILEEGYFNRPYHGEKNQAVSAYFSRIFNQANVLDLGCGVQAAGYRIADFSNAKKYIGVEKNFGRAAFEATSKSKKTTPFEIVQDEMIHYLESSDESFDIILLVGIDSSIVPRHKLEGFLKVISQKLKENGKLITSHAIADIYGVKTMFEIDPEYERLIEENKEKLALKDDKSGEKIKRNVMLPMVWRKLAA